jgi:hypothetical protein
MPFGRIKMVKTLKNNNMNALSVNRCNHYDYYSQLNSGCFTEYRPTDVSLARELQDYAIAGLTADFRTFLYIDYNFVFDSPAWGKSGLSFYLTLLLTAVLSMRHSKPGRSV